MRILQITNEPPFDADKIATGNAIRARQLKQALEHGGHAVDSVFLDSSPNESPDSFTGPDQLRSLIQSRKPDVILVSYWELLGLLPFGLEQPVVLDFVAPRPLEELFENPSQCGQKLQRLRVNLARCDLLLTGNKEQQKLLLYWLIEAGIDLREGNRTVVFPLAAEVVESAGSDPASDGFTLVGGGVSWPWREAEEYMQAIRDFEGGHPGKLRLVVFGGKYRWHEDESPGDKENDAWELTSYQGFSSFLSDSSHVGLELGTDNIERRFSQSFRSLDFLRHGLPLICDQWLPIADLVKEYEAGWVIDSPADLEPLLEKLVDDPASWHTRRANALKLVRQALNPDDAAREFLKWLESPDKAPRLPGYGQPPGPEPVLGVPPLGQRLARKYRLARRVALGRWFNRGENAGTQNSLVMVSRADIFPADHGAAVKIVETARGLSFNGYSVAIVTDRRDAYWLVRNGEVEEVKLPLWLRLLSRPAAWVKLDHYTKDIPESNAFLYLPLSDGSYFWRTLYVAAQTGARYLQAEFPAYALPCIQAGEVLNLPTIMVEHNVEYDRMRTQVASLSDKQYATLKELEIDLCNRCDAVICVSDNDRQTLASDGVHPGLLHTIPHGIDLAAYKDSLAFPVRETYKIPEKSPLLVYHGTFAYPPNRDALNMFADAVLPTLEQQGIIAHVLAVGHQPPDDLHPRIHCTGSVEHVEPYLQAADVAAVPLREGGGTRMKIIDYFAAGVPVVSTSKGIEGIPAVHGQHAMITDDPAAMCEAISRIISDQKLSNRLVKNGRAFAEGLDWSAIGRRYLELFKTL